MVDHHSWFEQWVNWVHGIPCLTLLPCQKETQVWLFFILLFPHLLPIGAEGGQASSSPSLELLLTSFSFFLFFFLLLRTLYHLSETSWVAATTYCLLEGHSTLPHRCSNCSFNPTNSFWQSTHLHLCVRHWCFEGPQLCHCKNAGDDFVHSPLQGIGV